ncbi:MAG: hypothetical protein H0V39_05205 [Nitrosomonas sp.]|nr:hypothetical protein [Nitrosomonas sp.]
MKAFLFTLFLILSQLAFGQPATLQGTVFTIPQGAVIDNNNLTYFTDIQLSYEGSGNFKLISAQSTNLVSVDSVQTTILESFPVQVNITVSGNKSVPCVELLPPAISRQDNLFIVVLAETQLGPAESCIAIIDPFETTFSLDVLELPAGTYTVRINGQVEDTFTFDVDNSPIR